MPNATGRRCSGCGTAIDEYAAGLTLCAACTDERWAQVASTWSEMRVRGTGTDELVRLAVATWPQLDADALAAAIPRAIDMVYAIRDTGGTMHDAGAAAAITALLAAAEVSHG